MMDASPFHCGQGTIIQKHFLWGFEMKSWMVKHAHADHMQQCTTLPYVKYCQMKPNASDRDGADLRSTLPSNRCIEAKQPWTALRTKPIWLNLCRTAEENGIFRCASFCIHCMFATFPNEPSSVTTVSCPFSPFTATALTPGDTIRNTSWHQLKWTKCGVTPAFPWSPKSSLHGLDALLQP